MKLTCYLTTRRCYPGASLLTSIAGLWFRCLVVYFLISETAFPFTIDIPTKTGRADGSYPDVTNLMTTVLARHENSWVLTFGSLGTTNSYGTGRDVISIFTTNSITFGGPPTTDTNQYWTIRSTAFSPGIFSAANTASEFGPGVNYENTIRCRYIKFVTDLTNSTGTGPIIHRRGIGRRCFRYDHLIFAEDWKDCVFWTGYGDNAQGGAGPYGLVDHCQFNNSLNAEFIKVGVSIDTHNYDLNPQAYGTEFVVDMEDCKFHKVGATSVGTPAFDTSLDARVLFRYNTLDNYTIVTHGHDSDFHAGQQYEILHNILNFSDPSGVNAYYMFFRGGNGYIFDNDFYPQGRSNCLFYLAHYNACSGSPYYNGCNTYPCAEQIGQGVTNGPAIITIGTYFHNNRNNGVATSSDFIVGFCTADAALIQANRDYFTDTAKPGWTELAYPNPLIALTTASDEGCSYSLGSSSAAFAVGGGTGTVSVTASVGCPWTAVSNDGWITVTGGSSGTGGGTVSYSVAANSGGFRTGTMTIAGSVFTVNENGIIIGISASIKKSYGRRR